MDNLIKDIIEEIRHRGNVSEERLATLIRASNKGKVNEPHNAKKYLMPHYLDIKANNQKIWKSWNLNDEEEQILLTILKVKPKRSASGVATITLITKPWPCGGNCLFCPNDIRMPKSYLSDEPACQRAERNFFDPYLQLSARLRALHEMGHSTDKVEVIILGGTWNDYAPEYQRWFISETFRALNDGILQDNDGRITRRENLYINAGFSNSCSKQKLKAQQIQSELDKLSISYNKAFAKYYGEDSVAPADKNIQKASWEEVERQQSVNERAKHRCVGLVVETRPAILDEDKLKFMRRLGCTKVQIGVQSLVEDNMKVSDRETPMTSVASAFKLLRKYGFKIHAHFMANLPGATPESDKKDYKTLVNDPRFLPDEIKLYPCMLVKSARLNKWATRGKWKAYNEDVLVDVLAEDVLATPSYTRISRMMRDISSKDITQGVKKTNLRQMVEIEAEKRSAETGIEIQEIRHREIALSHAKPEDFEYIDFKYKTTTTTEHFLQYVTENNKIIGFLRLSLPNDGHTAMIREVHVYGIVAGLGQGGTNAQHLGLGTKLIEKACEISKNSAKNSYTKINVISAIGTRQYYRSRGFLKFSEDGLYQTRIL